MKRAHLALTTKGNLRPGTKALLEGADDSIPITTERLNELFETAAIEALRAASNDSLRQGRAGRCRLSLSGSQPGR